MLAIKNKKRFENIRKEYERSSYISMFSVAFFMFTTVVLLGFALILDSIEAYFDEKPLNQAF